MQYDLHKNITLDTGETINKLELDFDSLAFVDLKNAKKVKAMLADATSQGLSNPIAASSPRFDDELRIGIAWVAAIRGTKGLSINDVLKLSARDAMELSEVALTEYCF